MEVAQQTALVWAPQQALFHGGAGFGLAIALELYVVRYALAIEIVQPCRAQRALEAGAGDKGLLQRAGVHVAFDFLLIENGFAAGFNVGGFPNRFFIFLFHSSTHRHDYIRMGFEGGSMVAKKALNASQRAAPRHVGELLALQVVQGSSAGVKAVEQAIINDVVGRLKVFAAANVHGRQRRQVQPVGG